MPILNADEAANVIVLKRSMNPGFAGIENELFYDPKTTMLFGDAKASVAKLVAGVKAGLPRPGRTSSPTVTSSGLEDTGQHAPPAVDLGQESRPDRVSAHRDRRSSGPRTRRPRSPALAERPLHDLGAAHGEVLLHRTRLDTEIL